MPLGKLVRANWSFYFESADSLAAVTPDKQSRFKVELGDDDILHLPHNMRSGRQSAPLPEILRHTARVLGAKRVPEALNALLLHDIFFHRGMEKVYKTLMHTCGYVAQRLPDPFCWVCAQSKPQRRGLRTHAKVALLVEGDTKAELHAFTEHCALLGLCTGYRSCRGACRCLR